MSGLPLGQQPRRIILCLAVALLALGTVFWLLRTQVTQGASYWHVHAPYPLESERFGVGGDATLISEAQWEALGAGWYIPWGAQQDPPHPAGVAMMQTIWTIGERIALSERELVNLIQANPAAVWRVGNEPDSPWQSNATPEQYARVYHELYHFIKAQDPAAQVAFGGLVQATPLRLLYLDFVWQAYQDLYSEPMPVDVWLLHSFILPETVRGWGAGIPPGMSKYAYLGMRYEMRDHDDVEIFGQRIRDFRRWMADHGQRHKPLLIPEYGCLLWPDLVDEDGQDFSDDRVIAYMVATYDFLLSAADPQTGYYADGDRLVQAWAWYSLDDDSYADGQKIGEGYNGDLFTGPDADTRTMTRLGEAFAAYVAPLRGPDYTDLWPLRLEPDLNGLVWGETAAITLTAEVANHGRQPAQSVPVGFWHGEPGPGGTAIVPSQVLVDVPGRYEGTGTAVVTWTTLVSGTHTLWTEVDLGDTVPESDETNNLGAFAVDLNSNLHPVSLGFSPPVPLWHGDAVTVTVTAVVRNAGPVAIPGPPTGPEAWIWVGPAGHGEPAARFALGPLAAARSRKLTAPLAFTKPGPHLVTIAVDPTGAVVESDEGDNTLSATLLVATHRLFLPLLFTTNPPGYETLPSAMTKGHSAGALRQ